MIIRVYCEFTGNTRNQIESESGLGRYDIVLIPKNSAELGIVIELKAKKSAETASLESLADAALAQIDAGHYLTNPLILK